MNPMSPYEEISVEELKARLNAGERPVIIDVREPEEVAYGMIPGAKHLPMGQIPQRLEEIPREGEVIFVCRSSHRSAQVCEYLTMIGFEKPVNMVGGMLAWGQLP
jgi:rhodanese-related sulfurtransferase